MSSACIAIGAQPMAPPVAASPVAGSPPSFAAVFATRSAAVVDITTLSFASNSATDDGELEVEPGSDFADRLPRPLPASLPVGGFRDTATGVVMDRNGLILTSAHVITGIDEVQVYLSDGRRFVGRVLGVDKATDTGLLRIDATDLPLAVFGDSSALAVGDWVAAIGSPFGFHNTVTAGVVSATGRYLPGANDLPFVQTDVAINPGSSGSPLFNARGEVVAINSMILSDSGGYMGLSFAVPINLALEVAVQLRDHGSVRRARMGADFQEVTSGLAGSFGLEEAAGAVVIRVEATGPAATAGLLRGDIVRAVDGARMPHYTDLRRNLAQRPPGSRVRLELWRGGRSMTLGVTLAEEPTAGNGIAGKGAAALTPPAWNDGLGLRLVELSPAQRIRLGEVNGLLVREAAGAARSEGVRTGDVIVAINETAVDRVDAYVHILSRLPAGRTAALLVRRDKGLAYIPVRLPERAARSDLR